MNTPLNFWVSRTENASNSKRGGSCEALLSENDFEAVLANFSCCDYGANASEEVQKISARKLLEECQVPKTANFIATPIKKHI